MYTLHKVCFDCTIKYEDTLKKVGLYEAYAKKMLQGNMITFAADIEAWVLESLNETDTFVTEQGDVEDWKNNNTKFKKEVLDKLQEYLKHLKSNIDS
jgi:L-lactate utilization protein LutB